jgi:DNA-binding CsgD family transcriptional regulator
VYTQTEIKVIGELIKGLSRDEIGKNLKIKTSTVSFHLGYIRLKTNTKTAPQFIVKYYQAALRLMVGPHSEPNLNVLREICVDHEPKPMKLTLPIGRQFDEAG